MYRSITAIVAITLLCILCPFAAHRIIASPTSDSLSFSAHIAKDTYVECEKIWAFFVLKNSSERVLSAVYPDLLAGSIKLLIVDESNDTIFRSVSNVIGSPVSEEMNSRALAVGDSLIGYVNLGSKFAHVIGENGEGSTLCHELGKYRALITYVPLAVEFTLSYGVVEPSGMVAQQLTDLKEISTKLFSPDYRGLELRIQTFLTVYHNSVYLEEVYRLWGVLFTLPANNKSERFKQVSRELIERLPDSPTANNVMIELIQSQTILENERTLSDIAGRAGHLTAIMAMRLLAAGEFRKLSIDGED